METPRMSEGSRSGVNWMRLKRASMERARALARVVLPVPGKSSSNRWPSLARAASTLRNAVLWPWITRSMFPSNFWKTSLAAKRAVMEQYRNKQGGCKGRTSLPVHLVILLQRFHPIAVLLEGSDAQRRGLRTPQRRHDRRAGIDGRGADFHLVSARGLACGGVDRELDFAVLQQVERIGPAFGNLEYALDSQSGLFQHASGAGRSH